MRRTIVRVLFKFRFGACKGARLSCAEGRSMDCFVHATGSSEFHYFSKNGLKRYYVMGWNYNQFI
jgi:hypothetical protein